MKITMEVDCSPEEARRFMGLPDVSEINAEVTKQMGEAMLKAAGSVDTENLMKAWMPLGSDAMNPEGFAALQKNFWQSFTGNQTKVDK